jgi:hypothetical protein
LVLGVPGGVLRKQKVVPVPAAEGSADLTSADLARQNATNVAITFLESYFYGGFFFIFGVDGNGSLSTFTSIITGPF